MPKTDSRLNTVGFNDDRNNHHNVDWELINFNQVDRQVFKLQKRIYKAAQEENYPQVRKLQKLLVNSWFAKVLAVKKVTEEVDKFATLSCSQKIAIANSLKLSDKSKSVVENLAKQVLLQMALEPEWESKFDPNSYGFRVGRCSHDALKAIFKAITSTSGQWVLNVEVAEFFENFNHQYLLDKLNTNPQFRRQIKVWLKKGAIDWSQLKSGFSTTTVKEVNFSCLLVNIALCGMENFLKDWLITKSQDNLLDLNSLTFVKYETSFLIIHREKEIVMEAYEVLKKTFLEKINFEKQIEAKTSLNHTNKGFDFLGCHLRQYKSDVNKERITLIKPSDRTIKAHYQTISTVIDKNKASTQRSLILKLNPIIKKWCNYYRYYCDSDVYKKLDFLVHNKIKRWCTRRHSNKSKKWIFSKYFHFDHQNGKKWDFREDYQGQTYRLIQHCDIFTSRYTQVKSDRSVYDGDNLYWSERLTQYPFLLNTKKELKNNFRAEGEFPVKN